ncbi:MAG: hypothetical protein LQ351_006917 [Letrouitia transgressa]|nr:MAG: hypothetical protein LQ351_006917 [Letrouitia transgressa]
MNYARICSSCRSQLLWLLQYGFNTKPRALGPQRRLGIRPNLPTLRHTRLFTVRSSLKNQEPQHESTAYDEESIHRLVRQTRQAFGDVLPDGFLSPEELKVYVRLYGPSTGVINPENAIILQEASQETDLEEEDLSPNALFEKDFKANLTEADYQRLGPTLFRGLPDQEHDFREANKEDEDARPQLDGQRRSGPVSTGSNNLGLEYDTSTDESEEEIPSRDLTRASGGFEARFAQFSDKVVSERRTSSPDLKDESNIMQRIEEDDFQGEREHGDQTIEEFREEEVGEDENGGVEDFELAEDIPLYETHLRHHPLTVAGKYGTSPTTLQIPKASVVEPIMSLLANVPNKHLTEVSHKTFGGSSLPNSTATPRGRAQQGVLVKQQPIALEASQHRMGEMEANTYLAAIMPGAYAAIMGTLVEVRKRLGSDWLRSLLMKEGGPRVLDAGAGGAGILAWRDILQSEWESMQPDDSQIQDVPLGKATVVTGSSALRHRASRLLQNTTFLPRLPDYNPSVNHPAMDDHKGTPRKQYDIVLAPHTLWTLKEDYMRKSHVQNLWSLLNPEGGVLILLEKGLPRGFELVAAAREVLLKFHISSPGNQQVANRIDEPSDGRYRAKEKGMIVAPCTNHAKCPMYLMPGKSVSRKDFCHFNQRFLRPSYLQRILGTSHRNHEDIQYSYVAVQRGVDQRELRNIQQGHQATDAAFAGYKGEAGYRHMKQSSVNSLPSSDESQEGNVETMNPLSFPRNVLPPLKRSGHVILDLCTPAGKLERWTVPRSFGKQAYYDARKAKWGDLWALGAKTRVPRNLRIGRPPRDGRQAKGVCSKSKPERRTKNGRKPKYPQRLTDDDLDL